MRVAEIQLNGGSESCQLQAWVESDRAADDGNRFAPFWLWYRFPRWCESYLNPEDGTPFLAALLVPAMMMGERLVLPAAVSPKIMRRLDDIQSIYLSFDPRLTRVEVEAPSRVTSPASLPGSAPTANGLFFSLGVDAFYSLFKNQLNHPADDETISHLITIHGFDLSIGDWDERFPAMFLSNAERVAAETGTTLLPVATNLRQITRPISRWHLSHGSALASVALALDGLLNRVQIAASTTYDQLYPWGSHPVLDPLWSTDRLAVLHDGCEMGRIDKVRFVARSQLALDTLKVCPAYNCGRCLKCLQTMIDLMQAGVLERSATFPHEVDVDRLRAILRAYQGQFNIENYERRLASIDDANAPAGLREAIVEFLANEAKLSAPRTGAEQGRASSWARLRARVGRTVQSSRGARTS